MPDTLLLGLSSSNGIVTSPSLLAGHCLDEPGTLGWKLYQAERKENLRGLKLNKLFQERADEERRKVQEKVELWKRNNQRFETYDPNFDFDPNLPKIVEEPKKSSLATRKQYSRVPTAGSGRSAHVHFLDEEFSRGIPSYIPSRIRTRLTSEIIAPGRVLPETPERNRFTTYLSPKSDPSKYKGSRSKTSVTPTASSAKVKKSISKPRVQKSKSNLDNVSIAARAGSAIGSSVKVKKPKSQSNVKKSNLNTSGTSPKPGIRFAAGSGTSKVKVKKSGTTVKSGAPLLAGTGSTVKKLKSRPKPKNLDSAASAPATAIGKTRKSKIAPRKKSLKHVGFVDNKGVPVTAGLAETQIGNIGIENSSPENEAQVQGNTKKAPRFNFNPKTPLPGTPEWDRYWKGYHKALAKFDKDMGEFSAGLEEYDDILAGYRQEAQRITNEEKLFKAGLDLLGSSVNFTPVAKPPPMRRVAITEAPIAFNGYVISSRKVEGTISNQLGMVNGIVIQVHIGNIDPDTLEVERDNHFFTLSFGNKRHFLHICVPTGKSPTDVVMHSPLGGNVFIEGP